MNDKPKRPLAEARAQAERLIEMLRPGCERIEIAGSVRREKPEVGDVEIVCAPRVTRISQEQIFGPEFAEVDSLWAIVDGLVYGSFHRKLRYADYIDRNGKFTQKKDGPKYRGVCFPEDPGFKFEIFTVPSMDDWGVNFTIRTGSAEFSRQFVTRARYCGVRVMFARLWRLKYLGPANATIDEMNRAWETASTEPEMRAIADNIVCPEERDFFRECGIRWVPPQARNGAEDVRPI